MQTSPRNKEEKTSPQHQQPSAPGTRRMAQPCCGQLCRRVNAHLEGRKKKKKDQHQNRSKITVFSTLSVPARQADALPRSGTKLMFLSHAEPSTILALQTTAACFSAETLRAPLDIIRKSKLKEEEELTLESFPFTTCSTARKTQSFRWEVVEALQQQPKPSKEEIPEPCSPGPAPSPATSCTPKDGPSPGCSSLGAGRGGSTWCTQP